jgi:hypothetical protein
MTTRNSPSKTQLSLNVWLVKVLVVELMMVKTISGASVLKAQQSTNKYSNPAVAWVESRD